MPFVERLQAAVSAYRDKSTIPNKLNQALYTSWYSPFMPIQEPYNYTDDLIKGYMDSQAIYSIVNKIADTASNVPIKLYDSNGKEVKDHWTLDVLGQPNKDTSFKELLFNYYVYLLSIGNSYLYSPKLDRGESLEIWTMPSDLVLAISGTFFYPVSGYKFKEGNKEIVFDKAEVMHGKLFNPRFRSGSWVYGLSPISVASEIISTLEAGDNAMEASFNNGGPAYIISSQLAEGLTAPQQESLEAIYKKKYQGAHNANNPMLSGTPLKVEKLGISPVDLNIIDSSKYGWTTLCNIYGVSDVLFNNHEASTYNNVSQARKDFYQFTIEPLNLAFAGKLKQFLIPRENLQFKFDYSDVEVLQESFFTRSESLNNIWYMTPNEKRVQLGLEELPDPLMNEIYKPNTLGELGGMEEEAQAQTEFLKEDGDTTREVQLQAI